MFGFGRFPIGSAALRGEERKAYRVPRTIDIVVHVMGSRLWNRGNPRGRKGERVDGCLWVSCGVPNEGMAAWGCIAALAGGQGFFILIRPTGQPEIRWFHWFRFTAGDGEIELGMGFVRRRIFRGRCKNTQVLME